MAEDVNLVGGYTPDDLPSLGHSEEQASVANTLEGGPRTNSFDQFDSDPDAREPGLYERARLHFNDAFYRGTLNGSSKLAAYAKIAYPDDPNAKDSDSFPDLDNHLNPTASVTRKEIRERHEGITADLARYDAMRPFGDTFEFLAAGGGSFAGGMMSPESFFGMAGKGATAAARVTKGAIEQGAIQAITDPVVQFFSRKAGVSETPEYDPWRTAINAGFGVLVGGGLVGIHELIPSPKVKEIIGEQGVEDKSFARPDAKPAPEAPKETIAANENAPAPEAAAAIKPQSDDIITPVLQQVREVGSPLEVAKKYAVDPEGTVTALNDLIPKIKEAEAALKEKYGVKTVADLEDAPLTKAESDFLFHGNDLTDTKEISRLRSQLSSVGSLDEAERELADQFSRLPADITNALTRSDQFTLARMQVLFSEVEHLGGDVDGAIKSAAKKYAEKFADSDDAEFMVRDAAEKLKKLFEGPPAPSSRPMLSDAKSSTGILALKPEQSVDELALAQRRGGGTLKMEQRRPQAGVQQPNAVQGTGKLPAGVEQSESPARDVAVKSLQQQAVELAKALDVPLRQGRITMKNALGVYKTLSGVVRVKEVPDFEVVAHELGHAIEGKAGQPLTDLTLRHAVELQPLDYDQGPGGRRVNEGFAEWMRRYLGNPANAKQVAPGFSIAFENFMQANHPEVLQILKDASAAYRQYLEAPSVDVVAAVRRSKAEEARGWGKVKEFIKENGFTQSIKLMMQKAYTALLDDKAPVARSVRELARIIKEQSGGNLVALKAADNPEVLLRLSARSHQAAMHDMMDGVYGYHSIQPEGPSLFDALAKATGKPSAWGKWDPVKKDDFSSYLIARRASVLWDKFERGDLPNPPTAFSKGDAIAAMADFEKANPTFREASDMVHGWTRQMLTKQYEGHLIGEETYYKLMDEPFYVPFMRDLSDRPLSGESSGRGEKGASRSAADTIKKMKGSSRDILDPIESLMTQAFLINRTLKHNDVILALEKLSTKAYGEGGKYFEPIPAKEMHKYTFDLSAAVERAALERGMDPVEAKALAASMGDTMGADDPIVGSFFRAEPTKPRGEPIVFYKKNGEMKSGRVMTEREGHPHYETLTALPEAYSDLWVNMVAGIAAVKRASIVTEPVFALTNYIRDQFASAILRSDYIPIVSGIRGIVSEFRQGEAARGYALGGGVSPGASIAQVEHAIEKDVNALAKKGYLVNRVSSLHGLLELTAFTEAGTRNSIFGKVFDQKRAQGLSEYEALIEAAYQAQDILDFSRHGSRMLALKKLLPFVNAHSQGLDKARRTIFEPIARKITGNQVLASDAPEFRNALNAAFKVFGVGGVLGAAWAAINSDSEAYKDASPYLKGTHLVVPWGRNVIVVPKPFELSIGMTAGEYAFQAWQQDDPSMAAQFVKAAWQVLEPPNPLTDIPGISTAIQLSLGKSIFTGNDIVPDRLQRLPANQQYTERTSSIAKYIGDQIGVSPMKVDFAIGDLFGTWGRDVQVLSQAVDSTTPSQSLEDRVFLRRLIKDPGRTSDVTTRFWNYMGQTTGKYNQDVAGYDALVKSFNDVGAQQFLDKLPGSEKAWVTLKSGANEDGKPAFNADEKRLHPLQRAYDAVTLLNGLRRELTDDTFHTFEKGEQMKLPPTARRDLLESVRELSQMEMRNAFVIMKEGGYQNRQLFDTAPVLEKIKAISPEVADEIRTRYATSKIYTMKAVAAAYPEMQKNLVRDGSEADLADLASDAKAEGYEFGAERISRPKKRRIPIPAASQ